MSRYFLRTILPSLAAVFLCIPLNAQRIVCDDTCKLADAPAATALVPSSAEAASQQEPAYAVVSPVGRSSVEMIQQAPRLQTLDGKTIAVVGVSFMTGVTHPEIKRLILENYPSAKVVLLDEIGIAGPYPAPGVTRKGGSSCWEKVATSTLEGL